MAVVLAFSCGFVRVVRPGRTTGSTGATARYGNATAVVFFVGFEKISKRQSPERARSESLHEGREGPERPCVFAEPQQR